MWWSGRNKPKKIISTINMPNGANWYQVEENMENTPKTFEAITFPFLEDEKEREELMRRINVELTSPGSKETPVYSLIVDGKGSLVPVAENTYRITAPSDSFRWKEFLSLNFTSPDEKGKVKLKNYEDDITPVISPFFQGEPEVSTLAFPWLNSELELEYVAKAGFIEACLNNQWLMPYANRLSWRFVDENGSITVPHWRETDLDSWYDVEYSGPSERGFMMSDGKIYPYPQDMEIESPDVLLGEGVIRLEGKEFSVEEGLALEYPKINRKQRSVARIAKEISEGLIPFSPPYPVVVLDDAFQRIRVEDVFDMAVVYLEPNKLILGTHSIKNHGRALNKYRGLWNEGELLTDHGHANYSDSYSELDERSIVRLNLTDEDL